MEGNSRDLRKKNEIVKKGAAYRVNKTQSFLFKKTNTTDEQLARLMKKQRDKQTQRLLEMSQDGCEEIKMINRDYGELLSVYKCENFGGMVRWLEKYML